MRHWWILGHGKIATALTERLDAQGAAYDQSSARDIMEKAPESIDQSYAGIILATTDATIGQLAEALGHLGLPMMHLSGATSIDVIPDHVSAAVWWPMQSFNGNKVPWGDFPTFIEYRNQQAEDMLRSWADDLGIPWGIEATSAQRPDYHLGAVFANNFSNHIIGLYQAFFRAKGLDREVFDAMLRRTIERALNHEDAHDLQTGPAFRGEHETIAAHRARLPEELKSIFDALTESIQQHAK